MLNVSEVVLDFGGIRALDTVGFTVGENEICGLIGPNGAGKTSLFNCITRIYQPDAGHDPLQRRGRPARRCAATRSSARASRAPSRTWRSGPS